MTEIKEKTNVDELQPEHVVSYWTHAAVLLALLALTGVTIAVSRFDMGALNIWVAISVAAVKSSFVLLFFMHLLWENRLIKYTLVITIVILALLIGFIFWDVSFR